MPTENTAAHGYASLIAKATGAPAVALPILEEIMRTEIFHSTLDWQSAEEFRTGARRAYELYAADREFYEAQARWKRASFRLFTAEQALASARRDSDGRSRFAAVEAELEASRFEEAAARLSLEKVSVS